MKITKSKTGIVVEKDGKFWGIQYKDGHSTAYGFGPIENSIIQDPRYCTKPTDVTYKDSPYLRELSEATLRHVVKTVIYEIEGLSE